jgi:hypothetical protein
MSPQRLPHTKSQYTAGIAVETLVKNLNLSHFKIVVVETTAQNTFRRTRLHYSTLNILYTENNRLVAEDKGNRELGRVHDCIHHHAVADDDFVVKMMTEDTFYSTTASS